MKKLIKQIVDLACMLLVSPLVALVFLMGLAGGKDRIFPGISQLLSLIPGLSGCYLRKNFYRLSITRCAGDCAISFGTILSHSDTEIGSGVYMGAYCNIGKSKIEDHCTFGSNVHILSGRHQHNFSDLASPIQQQGGFFEKISVGENTWIGNCAVIMANIGKKSIVGAGSVVTKDVEPFSVVAGNPARLIKKRLPGGS